MQVKWKNAPRVAGHNAEDRIPNVGIPLSRSRGRSRRLDRTGLSQPRDALEHDIQADLGLVPIAEHVVHGNFLIHKAGANLQPLNVEGSPDLAAGRGKLAVPLQQQITVCSSIRSCI